MKTMKELMKLKAELAIPRDPGDEVEGCGDGSCIIQAPKGQHTNGGCRCEEPRLRRGVRYWRAKAKYLQYELDKLRRSP
jgi:hypothetical protein